MAKKNPQPSLSKNSFWGTKTPIAIAHRGGAGLYTVDRYQRENSFKTFKQAIELGYQFLELDVIATADEKVVVLHATADKFETMLMKPSAPSAKKLEQYSLSGLKKHLVRDLHTLDEVLVEFPKAKFLIDAKTDKVLLPLTKIIQQNKAQDRVFLNSFFYERIITLQKLLGPKPNYGVIIGRHPRLINRRLKDFYRGKYFGRGFSAITVPRRFLKEDVIKLSHKHGLKVLVWSPNTKSQINKVIDLGVDGIISDNIKLLKHIVDER